VATPPDWGPAAVWRVPVSSVRCGSISLPMFSSPSTSAARPPSRRRAGLSQPRTWRQRRGPLPSAHRVVMTRAPLGNALGGLAPHGLSVGRPRPRPLLEVCRAAWPLLTTAHGEHGPSWQRPSLHSPPRRGSGGEEPAGGRSGLEEVLGRRIWRGGALRWWIQPRRSARRTPLRRDCGSPPGRRRRCGRTRPGAWAHTA
jgi:hypothetical protein